MSVYKTALLKCKLLVLKEYRRVRILVVTVLAIVLAIMTDVAVDVSGSLSTPPTLESLGNGLGKGFKNLPTFQEFTKSCRESVRPWSQFGNTSNFKIPPNFARFGKRAVNNVKYFQGNYTIISLILMAYYLITSPLLLLSIAASLSACYFLSIRNANKKVYIQGVEVSLKQQYGIIGLLSLPFYYWTGVGEAIFWVLGASLFLIAVHAGLYNIDEILSEQDQLNLLLIQQV